jgi:hypothetical protein
MRRVAQEPEVRKWITIPVADRKTITVDWDLDHLRFYLKTAEDFREWWIRSTVGNGSRSKQLNMVSILARIGAVERANNSPQAGIKSKGRDFGSYAPFTAKQRKALELAEQFHNEGRKTILYTHSPDTAERLALELKDRGIDAVTLHGGKAIKPRTKELDDKFRFGSVTELVATLGVSQTGLNIPQACRVIMLDRDWSAKTEEQAIARVLRPQQTRDVLVVYLRHPGSVDDYQAQMVNFKKDTARAGLDWATPELEDVPFYHIDTILSQFCNDLAGLLRCKPHELREVI